MSKYIPPRSRASEEDVRRLRLLRFKNTEKKQEYGFVSRGEDSRLQKSESAQREYFDWILEHFEPEPDSTESGERNRDKEKSGEKPNNGKTTPKVGSSWKESRTGLRSAGSGLAKSQSVLESERGAKPAEKEGKEEKDVKNSVDSTLNALRKLREALLHQKPTQFSIKVHLFSVRASGPVCHYQTYVPSINYLLSSAHMLSESELKEMASILVLHVSHINRANESAFRLFHQYLDASSDKKVFSILHAWVSGNYAAWLRMYNLETDHTVHAIMKGGLVKVMAHMVSCMTKSYFTMDASDFDQKCLPGGVSRAEFLSVYAPSWREEDGTVVIRQRRK